MSNNLYYAQAQFDNGERQANVKVAGRRCGAPSCQQARPQVPPYPYPYPYPYPPPPPPTQQQVPYPPPPYHVDMVPMVHQNAPAYPQGGYHGHLPIIIDATEPEPSKTTTEPPKNNPALITGPNGNQFLYDGNNLYPWPYTSSTAPPTSTTAAPTTTSSTTPAPSSTTSSTTQAPVTLASSTGQPDSSSGWVVISRNALNQVLSVICIFVLIMLLWTVLLPRSQY